MVALMIVMPGMILKFILGIATWMVGCQYLVLCTSSHDSDTLYCDQLSNASFDIYCDKHIAVHRF